MGLWTDNKRHARRRVLMCGLLASGLLACAAPTEAPGAAGTEPGSGDDRLGVTRTPPVAPMAPAMGASQPGPTVGDARSGPFTAPDDAASVGAMPPAQGSPPAAAPAPSGPATGTGMSVSPPMPDPASAPPGDTMAMGSDRDAAPDDGMRDVLLVGNAVSGSVSFIDGRTFENLGSVNIIPDKDEVLAAINADLIRAVAYPAVKNGQLLHHFEPSGGDRFVDDVFVSPDGETLYVSRSNLADVAAFDLTKPDHPRLWRTWVDGLKADHATISHDGRHLVVSATTANVSDVIDARTGDIIATFPTGDFPHQNDYSADGKSIYNSSIGNVSYMAVPYANNAAKGARTLVKVNAETFQVERTWRFEYGIRPNVITEDETILYTQLSYLNGVIKYDLVEGREIARSEQDLSEFALSTYASYDEYPHDSAHHGLALSVDGTRLCDCGTIDNNVAIVRTEDMSVEHMVDVGLVPYWATNDVSGRYCMVSLSGDNAVAVIEYETGEHVTDIPVGTFPQRSRLGRVPEAVIAALDPSAG